MLLFATGCLALLEVPGRRTGATTYSHGWPLAVLDRDYCTTQQFQQTANGYALIGNAETPEGIGLMQENWRRGGFQPELESLIQPWSLEATIAIRPLAALADFVIVAMVLCAIGWAAERHTARRQGNVRRRPFQFRLRTLLIGVAVLGVVMGRLASWHDERRAEERVLAELAKQVSFHWDISGLVTWTPPCWLPDSLAKLPIVVELYNHLDSAYFGTIPGTLGVEPITNTDATIPCLAGLSHLRSVAFGDSDLTDAGLQYVAGLSTIESVTLRNTHVTAAGIKQLARLPNLRELTLEGFTIDDAAVETLNKLPSLEELAINSNRANLVQLRGLSQLRKLSIDCLCNPTGFPRTFDETAALPPSEVPDDKVWHSKIELENLPKLADVSLVGTTLTESSLHELAALPRLETLSLDTIRLNGTSAIRLEGNRSLKTLRVVSSQVFEVRLEDLAGLESTSLQLNAQLAAVRLDKLPRLRSLACNSALSAFSEVRGLLQGSFLGGSGWYRPRWLNLRGVSSAPSLESLELHGERPVSSTLDEIGRLPKLRSLNLGGDWLADAELARLKPSANLKSLDLTGNNVTDAGLALLDHLADLITLKLDRSGAARERCLASLKKTYPELDLILQDEPVTPWPSLSTETIPPHVAPGVVETAISDGMQGATNEGLQLLSKLDKLQSLEISAAAITDAGLIHLRSLAGLKSLKLTGTHITDAGLEQLAGLHSLETLCLANTLVTGEGLRHLRGLTELKSLDLSDCELTNVGLANLKNFPKLERLNLSGINTTDVSLAPLAALKNLRKLDLSQHVRRPDSIPYWTDVPLPAVSDAALVHLRGLNHLETLSLAGAAISGPGLDYLRELPRLANLDLSGSHFTDAAWEHLAALTQIKKLSLSGIPAAATRLESLSGMNGLEELSLTGVAIPPLELAGLCGSPNLKHVYASQPDDPAGGALPDYGPDWEMLSQYLPDVTFDSQDDFSSDVFDALAAESN